MSSTDCRNDCTLPLRFPRRPGTQQATTHGDGCPCCYRATGVSQDNRPALSRFNYRIGTYGSIRQFLFHEIDRTPELLDWTHRAPDDPAVALLEGASILGDILTFYQEMYANEAFLRTAKWRESISDLVRLLGYRLSPAIGGNAVFAFEIAKEEPIVIPAGFPVKATLEKVPKPADFETLDQLTAYPWLSRFNLYKPLVQKDIEHPTTEFYISKPEQLLFPVEFKPGDRLLIGEAVGEKQLSEDDKKASEKAEPSGAAILAAEIGNNALLKAISGALQSAETILLDAESAKVMQEALIKLIPETAKIAASEAKMQGVNQAVGDLVAKAQTAWKGADDYYSSSQRNGDKVIDRIDDFASPAINRLSSADLNVTDRQNLIDAIKDEATEVKDALIPVVGKGYDSESTSRTARSLIIGDVLTNIVGVVEAARKATESEGESELADKVAIEAANNAMRLAAIAASSAAAGAADRVSASVLAKEAKRLADSTAVEAGQVKPAIVILNAQAIAVASATGFDAFLTGLTGGLYAVFAAANVPPRMVAWVNAYNAALREADESKTEADKSARKSSEVVDALSDSATKAAEQSIKDRQDALDAIGVAVHKQSDAINAADQMVKDRTALIKAINDSGPAAIAAKGHTLLAIEAARHLIELIKKIAVEDIAEALMPAGGVKDSETNPTRLNNGEIVIIDSVREFFGQKIYKIKGELKRGGSIGQLAAYKLGRTFHHFGYNGPPTTTKTDESTTSTATSEEVGGATVTTVTNPPIPEKNIAFSRLLASKTVSDETAISLPQNSNAERIVDPPLGKFEFPLESEVTDIPTGMTMVIQAELFASANTSKHASFTLVRKVKHIKQVPVTWGLMTGSSSIVKFDHGLTVNKDNARYRIADIRDFLIHETLSPLLTVKRAKEETDDASGSFLNFYGTADEVRVLKARRILLEKPKSEPYLRNVAEIPSFFLESTSKFKQLRRIGLSEPVNYEDFPNIDPQVTVFGNLADANEGKKMPEVPIGSGDAMQIFQNFKLPKAPLTYHLMPKNTPSETPELSIFVNGREWKQVDSFFGRGKNEHVYIVRQDTDGNSWVQFGDAKTGARLPSGIDNVTALYRTGDGAFGPLTEDTKVQASAKLKNLDKIQMPMDATGGGPAEDGESARSAAPGKVQSLGRIVSLRDYEAEAIAIPGVVSASAVWRLHRGVPAVAVTVLMETGRAGEIQTVENTLDQYDIERGAARNPIVVQGGARMFVALAIEYAMMPTYRADLVEPEIRRALGVNHAKPEREEDQTGLFSLRRRKLGAREYASSVEGWVQNIEGVLWAKATTFMQLSDEDDPASITVPDTTTLIDEVLCDGLHILSLYDEHLTLTLRAREVS